MLKIKWSLICMLVIVRVLMLAVGLYVDGNADHHDCSGA